MATVSALVIAALGGAGALLAAPRSLASIRLLELSLGWWAVLLAHLLGLAALALYARGPGPHSRR